MFCVVNILDSHAVCGFPEDFPTKAKRLHLIPIEYQEAKQFSASAPTKL